MGLQLFDSRGGRDLALVVLGCAMAASAALLVWETRGTTLAVDEWRFGFAERTDNTLSAYFLPHNGHLVAFPVLVTKVGLQVLGTDAALPLHLLAIGVHLATAGLLFVFLRRALGAPLALAPTVLFLFLGAAGDAFVGSHGLSLTLAPATGLSAWLLMTRRTPAADVAAAALLSLGILSSGTALPFCLGATALVLVDRDSPPSRLWVPAIPLAIYALWWLLEGHSDGQLAIDNLGGLPSYLFNSLGASLASITGFFVAPGSHEPSFDDTAGQALAASFLAVTLIALLSPRHSPPRATVPAIVAVVSFWLLTGLSADELRLPDSSRYLYIGVVLLLLVLGISISASPARRRGALILGAICAFALLPNVRELIYTGNESREQSNINRAVLGAADLVSGQIPGETFIEEGSESDEGNVQDLRLSLDGYIAARERFGSPAFPPEEIATAEPEARAAADRFLIRALPIAVTPGTGLRRPLPADSEISQSGGELQPVGACTSFRPLVSGAQVTLALPVGGLWIKPRPGPATPIGVRRYGDEFEAISPALGGRASRVSLPAGNASRGWLAQLAPEQPALICGGA